MAPPRDIHVVGAAILKDCRCLAARRGPDVALPGKWEFPGGKVESGETPEEALAREVAEELGLEIEVGAFLARGEVDHDGRRLVLDVHRAALVSGEVELTDHDEVRWLSRKELREVDWAEADLPALAALEACLDWSAPFRPDPAT